MAWGLSRTGFNRPNQAQLKEEIDQRQRELFGENVNLSPKSPNGILSGIISWVSSIMWQTLERVYRNGHVSEAEGVSLDYKTVEFNTSRNPEQYAEGSLQIVGTPNFTVLEGTRFEREDGTDYMVKENVVLDANGEGIAEIVSLSPGSVGNTFPNTITIQSEPSTDIIAVTNLEEVSGGREQETDDELRNRLLRLGATNGSGTTNAILADVLTVPGVRAVNIKVNSESVEVDGQPPHSNHVYVLGGQGEQIAEMLYKNFVGLKFVGSEHHTIDGFDIAYTPAAATNVYVNVALTTNITFPANGENLVKDAIVKVIGGLATDGTLYTGLNMGDDVIYSRVLSVIMGVPGVEDANLTIGTEENPTGTSNIAFGIGEVAQISANDIVVTL